MKLKDGKVLRMYLEKERLTEAFSEYTYRSYRPIPDLLMWVEMGWAWALIGPLRDPMVSDPSAWGYSSSGESVDKTLEPHYQLHLSLFFCWRQDLAHNLSLSGVSYYTEQGKPSCAMTSHVCLSLGPQEQGAIFPKLVVLASFSFCFERHNRFISVY